MEFGTFQELEFLVSSTEELKKTVDYLTENLGRFVRKQDKILICFPREGESTIGSLFEQAALNLSAIPLFWAPDHKWKTLLRQGFYSRASVIIGPPLVILGLSKLAKATGTPLYFRHVVTAGYPCLDWMIEGIVQGLDCRTWGCFGPGTGAAVSGFSCGQSYGVHIREDAYDIRILDDRGNPVPQGETGTIALSHRLRPDRWYRFKDHGRIDGEACSCGMKSPRLLEIHPAQRFQDDVLDLYQQLHAWTSILDCRIVKGPYGLELELVVFPGEKLPKLPSCARQVIRPWDPERDVPMDLQAELKES